MRYLAMGDSYTVGTAVRPEESFPSVLASHLHEATGEDVDLTNLGVNGYTTENLIADELPRLRERPWDAVTVLIGVNDFVRRWGPDRYRDNLRLIYTAIAEADLPPGRAVAVSIPDFSFTPAAAEFGEPVRILTGLHGLNVIAAEEAGRKGLTFVDVLPVSRSGADTPDWIAADGLHPGPAQHRAWAEVIWQTVGGAWAAR